MTSSLVKVVYVLLVLSIAVDFINLKGHWFNSKQNGEEITVHSSSLFLPGANGWILAAGRAAARAAARASRRANNARRTRGGAGKYHL